MIIGLSKKPDGSICISDNMFGSKAISSCTTVTKFEPVLIRMGIE